MMYTVASADEAQLNVLSHKVERLDNDLKKREVHLAELIDEILYAEERKEEAMRRAEAARYLVSQLESILQDLLGYLKLIEGDVLLPAFLELSNVAPQEPLMDRTAIKQALETIAEDNLSSRTKKLIAAVKDLPSETKNRATREVFLRNLTEESVNVGDAILLSGLLLDKKDELMALLNDLQDRVYCILQGNRSELSVEGRSRSVGVNKRTSSDRGDIQEQLRLTAQERDKLRQQLSQSEDTTDITRTFQNERKVMEQQLQHAHQSLSKEQLKSQEMKTHIKTLELNLEQLVHEKKILEEETRELKCDHASKGRFYIEQRRAEEEVRQLKAELDRLISENHAKYTTMESQIADLRAQNAILVNEKKEHNEQINKKVQKIETLQRSNEELQRELFELQQRVLSSSPSTTTYKHNGDIKRLESTVATLTQELGVVEKRMIEVSTRHQAEHNQIIAEFEEERNRYRAERKECDALVEKMANELERLAMENRSLRNAAVLQNL